MLFLLPFYTAITSAWSGGSLWGHNYLPGPTPEILFALAFALAWWPIAGWWCILAAVWSFVWIETGHANALPWGKGGHNPNRVNTLTPVVNWLCARLGIELYSVNYCRLFMAVKGSLIGLPVGGLPLAILWPLGYEIGERLGSNTYRELLAGFGAGVSILIFVFCQSGF